jgi:hypothetical protein
LAYAPNSVEIHPLSRFRNSSNPDKENLAIVQVEFKDGDNFACRAIGLLHVSLTDTKGSAIVTETISLDIPEVNRQYFDSVTRTYRVHINFNNVPNNLTQVVARATFTSGEQGPIRSRSFTIDK